MFSSAIFDTILGLVFVFYATAVVCSGAVEMFANWARKRAKYLLRGLRELLDDPGTIWTATESNPQAAPRTMIGKSAAPGDEKAHYTVALGRAWPDAAAEAKLKALWSTQLINHPLLKPYKHTDGSVRSAVVGAAASGNACRPATDGNAPSTECLDATIAGLRELKFPIGWSRQRFAEVRAMDFWQVVTKLFGLLLTTAAASLGAPFWFDQLNRLGSLRNVGTRPAKTS